MNNSLKKITIVVIYAKGARADKTGFISHHRITGLSKAKIKEQNASIRHDGNITCILIF